MKDNKIKAYERYLYENNLGESTIEMYMRGVRRLIAYAKDRKISKKMVDKYMAEMRNIYKPSTVNLYASVLNRYFRYLGRDDLIIRTKKLSIKRSLENVLSVDEYQKLLECAKVIKNYKYYAILRVLGSTGIRVGELKFITAESLENGVVAVYNKGKSREIYMPESLCAILADYCECYNIKTGTIFCGNKGKPITRGAIWQMLQKMADITGIAKEKVHPHSFRHMMAVEYMKQYGNIAELADILGHASIEVTRIYTVTTKEEKRKRLEQLGL